MIRGFLIQFQYCNKKKLYKDYSNKEDYKARVLKHGTIAPIQDIKSYTKLIVMFTK